MDRLLSKHDREMAVILLENAAYNLQASRGNVAVLKHVHKVLGETLWELDEKERKERVGQS